MTRASAFADFVANVAPYFAHFLGAFALSLFLTPTCRELSRKLGMVDKPGPRRINTKPIPRGGGLAIFLAVTGTLFGSLLLTGHAVESLPNDVFFRLAVLATVLVGVGFADDKFGLKPIVKLLGQLVVACGTVYWAGVAFHGIFSWCPQWVLSVFSVLWIVGAMNAFNLIDGLDGLATGLALIAVSGMAGVLFFLGTPGMSLGHFTFAGACLGFLFYNFHPASVFLGDTGSMYLGFVLATLPMSTAVSTASSNSLLVSIGVPLLSMGVPIFDTSLAILRRMVRRFLAREEHASKDASGSGQVMTADADHLHHRILRRVVSQRKAAWALYLLALFFVLVGLGGVMLSNRAAGLFILAFVVAVIVIVRDMVRVELWDAGRLASTLAREKDYHVVRRRHLIYIPALIACDFVVLSSTWAFSQLLVKIPITVETLRHSFPLFFVPAFFGIVMAKGYRTVWGRAQMSNYVKLVTAVFVGTAVGVSLIVFLGFPADRLPSMAFIFAGLASLGVAAARLVRELVRDAFYAIDRVRLADAPDVSRILVYGAGIRFRAFRRELVRASGRTRRIIMGIVDDDVLIKNQYIGGTRIFGRSSDAGTFIRDLRIDEVVIACELSPDVLASKTAFFKSLGVKVSLWSCEEHPL